MVTKLTITADFGGSTGQKTGVCELGEDGPKGEVGTASVSDGMRTGFLVAGGGQTPLNAYKQVVGGDEPLRRGIRVDIGNGQHIFEIAFQFPTTTKKSDGNFYQWGSSSSQSKAIHTATGQDVEAQDYVLMNYLRHATIDSFTPATFEWGEYTSTGLEGSGVSVAVEQPTFLQSNELAGQADATMTLVEIVDIQTKLDTTLRRP